MCTVVVILVAAAYACEVFFVSNDSIIYHHHLFSYSWYISRARQCILIYSRMRVHRTKTIKLGLTCADRNNKLLNVIVTKRRVGHVERS